ncbi:WD40 repeat domain-containing protein [Rodentibacter caecimuris]|uniref:WD40 repeat domain-containing protein n=1 Tax=Rodentibacter caecimuris TaxID=1796644 RepID=UPI0025828AE9|nr:WD40 repeat domain-containing protein [Rodentibacter heylii]
MTIDRINLNAFPIPNLAPIYTDAPIGPSQPYKFVIVGNYLLSVGDVLTARGTPPAQTKLTANPVNPDKYKKDSYLGMTLWNIKNLKPLARLWGNSGRTMGLISSDGKWIVATSENGQRYMWSALDPHQQFKLAAIDGILREDSMIRDKSKLLPIPEKFKDKQISRSDSFAVAFVTEKDFILLPNSNDELALLYTTGDPWIKAYVEIGNKPEISRENLSIASAYKANILVTGQYGRGGINVYKYHPETKELEKIWVAD